MSQLNQASICDVQRCKPAALRNHLQKQTLKSRLRGMFRYTIRKCLNLLRVKQNKGDFWRTLCRWNSKKCVILHRRDRWRSRNARVSFIVGERVHFLDEIELIWSMLQVHDLSSMRQLFSVAGYFFVTIDFSRELFFQRNRQTTSIISSTERRTNFKFQSDDYSHANRAVCI